MVQNHIGPIPWTQYLGSIPQTKYHEPNSMDQNLVFQHVRTFPSIKMCVYVIHAFVYSQPACIRDLIDGEPAYTLFLYVPLYVVNLHVYAGWSIVNLCIPFFFHSLLFTCYIVIFQLRVLPSRTTPVSYLYHNANNNHYKAMGKESRSSWE